MSVLLAALLVLALPGCKNNEAMSDSGGQTHLRQLREAVSGAVNEQDRRDRMLRIVGSMETVASTFDRDVSAFVESFRRLNTNYDTPRADFDALFMGYDAQRMRARDSFLDLHFQLTALATADEWKRIGKVEKKMYDELLKPKERAS